MSGGNMGGRPQMPTDEAQPPQIPDGENFDPNQSPDGQRPQMPQND